MSVRCEQRGPDRRAACRAVTRAAWLSALCLGLGACGGNATHLLYVHQANLGVDVSTTAEGTGKLAIGYDRETFAIVPRVDGGTTTDANGQQKTEPGEAMSLVSVASAYIKGLDHIRFGHLLATGKVAEDIAKNDPNLQNIKTGKQKVIETTATGRGGGQ